MANDIERHIIPNVTHHPIAETERRRNEEKKTAKRMKNTMKMKGFITLLTVGKSLFMWL